MNPDVPDTSLADEHVRDNVHTLQFIFGKYGWIVLMLISLVFFRGLIEQFVSVMIWKVGRRYNERMAVIVNGYFCRIDKIGLFYVEFFIYDDVNDAPRRGWSWLVAGNNLNALKIWIPLEKHEPLKHPIQTITTEQIGHE